MKPSEIFEGENSGLRKAFDEAVAREQSHIDQGKAGIDENLKSMNNGMVFNPNNMTNTEKILAEFDLLTRDQYELDLEYEEAKVWLKNNPHLFTGGVYDEPMLTLDRDKIRAFITTKIAQALAEEREIKVDLKQILKEQANWKHPNFGIIAEFVSGLGENGVVNYKVIKNT